MELFEMVTNDDILAIIMSSPNKQCDLDHVPTWLLKNCAVLLAPVVSQIINASLQTGHFPSSWKHATITPILKKAGLDPSIPSSYRPVSNLTFLSKVLEHVVHKQMTRYLAANNLPKFQSAYRKSHSTETALMKGFADLTSAIDDGQLALVAFLDLSAAFDTVDHQVLLHRMFTSYGVSSTAHRWFSSYLTDRTQSVCQSNIFTPPRSVLYRVPQGSVLGPLLFVLYSAEVGNIIDRKGLKHHCYADDTKIYSCCQPSASAGVKSDVLDCIDEITAWASSNRLQINPSKSEFIWCTTARRTKSIPTESFDLGGSIIQPSKSVRDLGAYIDSDMSMTNHISRLVSSCFYQLRRIKLIRRSLPTSAAVQLVNSFVISRIDYCNSLLFGLPAYQLHRVQQVLNAAARMIFGGKRQDNITPLLVKLHWLSVVKRVRFKICLTVYKSLNGLSPAYISEFLKPVTELRRRSTLRSATHDHLLVPMITSEFGKRSFAFAGPSCWNQLPDHVRQSPSVDTFKRRLKTHLFKLSYCT